MRQKYSASQKKLYSNDKVTFMDPHESALQTVTSKMEEGYSRVLS